MILGEIIGVLIFSIFVVTKKEKKINLVVPFVMLLLLFKGLCDGRIVGKDGLASQFTLNVSHNQDLGILALLQRKKQIFIDSENG